MRIKVFLGNENSSRAVEVTKSQTIESLLKKLKINSQTVIVMKNGEVVSEQDSLKEKDTLKIVRFK